MSNKKFLIALALFAWILSFLSLALFAVFAAQGVVPTNPDDALEIALWVIAVNGSTGVFAFGETLKGMHSED